MTTKEIEELIKKGLPLPATATIHEQYYYSAIDTIFTLYKLGKLNKVEFKNQQKKYVDMLNQVLRWDKIYNQHLKIRKELVQVEFKDCEICKKVARILEGREMPSG